MANHIWHTYGSYGLVYAGMFFLWDWHVISNHFGFQFGTNQTSRRSPISIRIVDSKIKFTSVLQLQEGPPTYGFITFFLPYLASGYTSIDSYSCIEKHLISGSQMSSSSSTFRSGDSMKLMGALQGAAADVHGARCACGRECPVLYHGKPGPAIWYQYWKRFVCLPEIHGHFWEPAIWTRILLGETTHNVTKEIPSCVPGSSHFNPGKKSPFISHLGGF